MVRLVSEVKMDRNLIFELKAQRGQKLVCEISLRSLENGFVRLVSEGSKNGLVRLVSEEVENGRELNFQT